MCLFSMISSCGLNCMFVFMYVCGCEGVFGEASAILSEVTLFGVTQSIEIFYVCMVHQPIFMKERNYELAGYSVLSFGF